jgi:prephenate dehydrogenase
MNNSAASPISVGIIGGKGKFGKFITDLLQKEGITPLISDVSTPLSNTGLVTQVSVVIIAVSIDRPLEVIQEIGPVLTEKHVLIDITSIKSPIVRALLQTKAELIC